MNQSQKLNLYIGLGCKPIKDVILHHPDWIHSEGHIKISNRFLHSDDWTNPDVYFEAIPEKLTEVEILANVYNIETKDYEVCAGRYVRGEFDE